MFDCSVSREKGKKGGTAVHWCLSAQALWGHPQEKKRKKKGGKNWLPPSEFGRAEREVGKTFAGPACPIMRSLPSIQGTPMKEGEKKKKKREADLRRS